MHEKRDHAATRQHQWIRQLIFSALAVIVELAQGHFRRLEANARKLSPKRD
jgi:hypothetical protein